MAIPGSQLESFEGVEHYSRCEEPARFVTESANIVLARDLGQS